VVLRTDLVDTEPVRAWLARLAADLSAARAHAEVAPDEIAEAIAAAREPGRNPLFDVLIDIAEPVELAVPGWTRLALDPSGAEVDLSISLARTTGWLELGYATDLYDAWRVERWAAEIAEAVAELTASPEQPVGALVAIHGAAADELQAFGRGAEIEAPPETLADVLRHAARKWPDAPAVVWPHGALTWRGLLIAAESRARRLGVPPGTAVGLWGEPSWQQLVSLWAIVLAGGAYVAADGPAERRRELWRAAGVDMALGPDDSALVVGSGRVPAAPAPGDPAYMLFTSEDAGPPRAVAVSHAAVVHRLRGEQQRHHLDARLRTVWLASLAFEVSVLEVVLPALVGGSVVIPDDRDDLESVVELVDREAVTDLQATPSLAVGLAELWATRRPPHALTRLSLDGENLPAALLDRLRGGLPGVQIGNHEGASEAVVEALAASDLLQLDPHPIGPHGIGRPLPGTLVRIVDPAGQPVPVGADGEVCVGGAALATGYSGSSALDTASFGPDPWGEVNGLYHTRDAGRWRPDGTVELRGRLDRPQR
jgi:non-ribosomal peptide synthetase component F